MFNSALLNAMNNTGPGTGGDGESPMAKEMRRYYKNVLPYDNQPAYLVAKNAAAKAGIDPSLFFSSAFQEGFNKAIVKPNEVSAAYENAAQGVLTSDGKIKKGQNKLNAKDYPVDGFYNYGLDTFASRYPDLVKKGYLPQDMNFSPYQAYNEKGEVINTAAFKNNQDALTAKAAIMRDSMDRVKGLAKTKGIDVDQDALNYLTLASYNGGEGNMQIMLDEYGKAKDKKAFISKGLTSRGGVHKNIAPRLANMKIAQELMGSDQVPPTLANPASLAAAPVR